MLLSAVILNCLGLALPLITLHVYDKVLPNQAVETLWFLVIGLALVAAAECALRMLQAAIIAPSSARYARDLKMRAVSEMLAGPVGGADKDRTPTEVLERFAAIDRIAQFYGGSARHALIDLPFAVIALVVIAVIGGPLVWAPLAALFCYLAALLYLGAAMADMARMRQRNDVKSADFLSETFSSIVTLKSLGLERLMTRRYERLLNGVAPTHERALALTGVMQRVSIAFGGIAIIATLSCAAALAMAGEMTVGAVAASTLLAGRAVQPGVRAARAWNDYQRVAVAVEAASKLFAEPLEGPAAAETSLAKQEGEHARGLRPLSAPTLALSGAPTIATPPGGLIGVRGLGAGEREGALRELAGLEPGDRFLVDGLPAELYRRRFPENVTFVAAGDWVFQASILDNLTLFGRLCSAQRAMAVAAQLRLDEDVRKLPIGYDTEVGASANDALSAGGLKKISLARALAQRAQYLIFDDPSAHLDGAGAAALKTALKQASKTRTIILSDRGDWRDGGLLDFEIALDGDEAPRLTAIGAEPVGAAQ